MVGKYSSYKFHEHKSASDFAVLSGAEMKEAFSLHPYRIHKYHPYVYELGERIIRGLGHGDITGIISIRDAQKLRVEAATALARRIAYYILHPQRYAHDPSNVIAPALTVFVSRLHRVRIGHKIQETPKKYMLGKREFGSLVRKFQNDDWLWDYAYKWAENHLKRVKNHHCYPL